MRIQHKTLRLLIFSVILAGLLCCVPPLVSGYMLQVLNIAMITYICVLSLYVLFGLCGQTSFAQCGFWGVGAYIAAILTAKYAVPPLLAMVCSIAGTSLLAFLLGFALFRLKRYYFAFSTIGLMMILNGIFQNWNEVTGGALGVSGIPSFSIGNMVLSSGSANYFLILAFSLLATAVAWIIYRSRLGRAFMAIRDNETAAACMGINRMITKNIAFTISAAFCGLAGALFAFLSGYISSSTFTLPQSQMYLVIIMLGGTVSPLGAAIGSLILSLLPEWFRPLQTYMYLIYGVGIMLLMVLLPEGLTGGGKALYERIRRRKQANPDA